MQLALTDYTWSNLILFNKMPFLRGFLFLFDAEYRTAFRLLCFTFVLVNPLVDAELKWQNLIPSTIISFSCNFSCNYYQFSPLPVTDGASMLIWLASTLVNRTHNRLLPAKQNLD